ncbi:MAG TPA: flagellar biosynthesis protein [Firmicutes bacterium]|nr:flagellar biosynthesis protein [Bacillota bacterium]
MDVNKINGKVYPAGTEAKRVSPPPRPGKQREGQAFARILADRLAASGEGVHFSAHASRRLQERSIALGDSDLKRLDAAMQQAAQKGARSSLLLYNDLALIANVGSKTIITAMSGNDLKEHVFTNIDSAVIIR